LHFDFLQGVEFIVTYPSHMVNTTVCSLTYMRCKAFM
jgi:hypothetical protein